jgi:hypothetical protein
MLSTSKKGQKPISTTPDYTPGCLFVQLSSCSNRNKTNNVRIEIATAKQLNHNSILSPKRTNKLSSTNTSVCTYNRTMKEQQQFATKIMQLQKYAQPNREMQSTTKTDERPTRPMQPLKG